MTQHWTLPADDSAPALARSAVSSLADRLTPDRLADIVLLISELVTNSVRHAGLDGADRIDLFVDVDEHSIRVEVTDPGPGFTTPRRSPSPDRGSGWGLHLVELLTERWGTRGDGTGTVTWFELAL